MVIQVNNGQNPMNKRKPVAQASSGVARARPAQPRYAAQPVGQSPQGSMSVMNSPAATGIPANGVGPDNTMQDTNINNLGQQSQQVTQMGAKQSKEGQANYNAGTGAISDSINNLNNTANNFGQSLGDLQNRSSGSYDKVNQAGDQSFNYLQQAMQRNVDPQFLQTIQGNKAANESAIQDLYSSQGLYGNLFLNQSNDKRAQLAERGFSDSTAGAATQAELARKFNQDRAAALLGNQVNAQNQILTERNNIGQLGVQSANVAQGLGSLYGNVGGQQGDQANQLRNYQANAYQTAGGLGNQLGQLGVSQGQLGAGNLQTGIGGQHTAITDYMNSLGTEAQIRMQEEILRNQLRQQNLNNVTTARQNRKNNNIQNNVLLPQLAV